MCMRVHSDVCLYICTFCFWGKVMAEGSKWRGVQRSSPPPNNGKFILNLGHFSPLRASLQNILKRFNIQQKTFEGENFCVSVQNENFVEKTFADCSGPIIMWVWPQNLRRKLSRMVLKPPKKHESFLPRKVSAVR